MSDTVSLTKLGSLDGCRRSILVWFMCLNPYIVYLRCFMGSVDITQRRSNVGHCRRSKNSGRCHTQLLRSWCLLEIYDSSYKWRGVPCKKTLVGIHGFRWVKEHWPHDPLDCSDLVNARMFKVCTPTQMFGRKYTKALHLILPKLSKREIVGLISQVKTYVAHTKMLHGISKIYMHAESVWFCLGNMLANHVIS